VLRIVIELGDQIRDRVGYITDPPPCSKFVGRMALNWITVANWLIIETMLILCVYGLWERSKTVAAGLGFLVVSLVTTAIILRDTRPDAVVLLEPDWLFPCHAWEPTTRFWLYIVGTIIQFCVFLMFVWKALRAWRPALGTRSTRLTKTLLIYCIGYYSFTLALMGVGIASALVRQLYLPIYTAQVLVPIVSVISLRLALSLRQILLVPVHVFQTNGSVRTETVSLWTMKPKVDNTDTGISSLYSKPKGSRSDRI